MLEDRKNWGFFKTPNCIFSTVTFVIIMAPIFKLGFSSFIRARYMRKFSRAMTLEA